MKKLTPSGVSAGSTGIQQTGAPAKVTAPRSVAKSGVTAARIQGPIDANEVSSERNPPRSLHEQMLFGRHTLGALAYGPLPGEPSGQPSFLGVMTGPAHEPPPLPDHVAARHGKAFARDLGLPLPQATQLARDIAAIFA